MGFVRKAGLAGMEVFSFSFFLQVIRCSVFVSFFFQIVCALRSTGIAVGGTGEYDTSNT